MEHKDYVTIKPGTAVTRKILDNLNGPDDGLKIIHVAGTNGKGSTAEYFTRILIAAGKKVGTFTSPAVYDYFEQFRINGKNIDE
ncbi:MAG: bifunctional folylpolyglutamate synthase/dihydrofolate synthase, partial [Clostridia bacterium]|nr:bifunctional folylpolyglutamate synthase/dihydrofolate synthase [Clostridia bacterium]